MPVVAIDTGATKIAGAVIDENGDFLDRVQYPNTGHNGPFIIDTYTRIISDFRERFPIAATGIGAGGRIDPVNGKVLFATGAYTDYIGLTLGTEISVRCGLPAIVDNECRMAVYGERWKGAAQGYDDVFGIILGTGVGGGYVQGGKPVYGAACSTGEVGHYILYPGGKKCMCGQSGCVEQYLSGTALWQSYNSFSIAGEISSGYEFFELLDKGDIIAKKVMDKFIQDLAVCTVTISNLLSPHAILLGGGLTDTADRWWDRFETAYLENGSNHCRNITLLRAATGNNAALLGAAWMAMRLLR